MVVVALFYGAGLAIGLVFFVTPSTFLVLWLLFGVAVVRTGKGHQGLLLFAGAMVGLISQADERSHCTHRWSTGPKTAEVIIHDTPRARGVTGGTVVRSSDGCDGEITLAFSEDAPRGGTLVEVRGQFRPPVLRVEDTRLLRSLGSLRYSLRSRVDDRIRRLYGARSGVVAAMVLGRKNDLPPTLKKDFASAGMSHLLAISGLHVGIIAGWIYLLVGLVGAQRLRPIAVAAGVWTYVALLAFPAPATRAAIFITVSVLAGKIERSPPPVSTLAVAAMGVFTIDPAAFRSIGAWLSISAVWGTALAGRELRRFGFDSALAKLVGSSVGATLATAPVTAFGFGAVAPVGVFANIVAVPVTGLIVPSVFLSLLVGRLMAGGAGMLLWFLEAFASVAAMVPGGHFEGQGIGFASTCAAITIICLWAIRRKPTGQKLTMRFAAGLVVLSWSGVAATRTLTEPPAGLAVYVIDVGQGDAIAVRTPHDRWVLIDAGPRFANFDAGTSVVVPFLRRMGVESLELLFVSHGDADHLGGVPAVLREFETGLVVDPGQPLPSGLFQEYLGLIIDTQTRWQAGRAGDSFLVDSVSFSVVHPGADWVERQLEPNENSLVMLLEYGQFSMLLTGDAGLPSEELFVAEIGDVDVLKVGHHGSASSTSAELLQAIRPLLAVISVGAGNSYGHPASGVLANLTAGSVDVVRTDMGGTVTILANGDYFDIRQQSTKPLVQGLGCLLPRLSLSNDSSSNRSACLRKQQAISRTYSTISP